MQSHVYVVVCTNAAGWRNEALWSADHQGGAEDRVFADRDAAETCYYLHADYDYTATAHEPAEPWSMQPEFEIKTIPTVEAVCMAALDDNIDLVKRIIAVAGCPPLPHNDDTPLVERVIAWSTESVSGSKT